MDALEQMVKELSGCYQSAQDKQKLNRIVYAAILEGCNSYTQFEAMRLKYELATNQRQSFKRGW